MKIPTFAQAPPSFTYLLITTGLDRGTCGKSSQTPSQDTLQGQQGKLWPWVKASLLPVFYTAFTFLMVEKFQMRKLFFDVKIMWSSNFCVANKVLLRHSHAHWCLLIVSDCFRAARAELSNRNWDCVVCKDKRIYCLTLSRKSWPKWKQNYHMM